MTCRILLYSNAGRTQKVGEELAWELGAQLHEIGSVAPEETLWSRLKMRLFSMLPNQDGYEVPDQPWDRSDLLILGTPVCNGKPARPLRQWLESHPALPDRIAFLMVSDQGDYPAEAVEEMTTLTGHAPVAVLHVCNGDLATGNWKSRMQHFLDQCVVRYRKTA